MWIAPWQMIVVGKSIYRQRASGAQRHHVVDAGIEWPSAFFLPWSTEHHRFIAEQRHPEMQQHPERCSLQPPEGTNMQSLTGGPHGGRAVERGEHEFIDMVANGIPPRHAVRSIGKQLESLFDREKSVGKFIQVHVSLLRLRRRPYVPPPLWGPHDNLCCTYARLSPRSRSCVQNGICERC